MPPADPLATTHLVMTSDSAVHDAHAQTGSGSTQSVDLDILDIEQSDEVQTEVIPNQNVLHTEVPNGDIASESGNENSAFVRHSSRQMKQTDFYGV